MNEQDEQLRYCHVAVAARRVGLSPSQVRRYLRTGLVRPAQVEGRGVLLGEAELARLRKIRRLSRDLGLNRAGVEVVLHLLDEIAALQEEVRRARAEGEPHG